MNLILAYQCGFCSRVSKWRSSTQRHEKGCFYNPATKSCVTCGKFCIEIETYYNRNHGGDPGSTDHEYKQWYCWDKKLDRRVKHCDLWVPSPYEEPNGIINR